MLLKMLIRSILGTAFMGLVLFVPAGTLAWPQAWVFLALFVGCGLALGDIPPKGFEGSVSIARSAAKWVLRCRGKQAFIARRFTAQAKCNAVLAHRAHPLLARRDVIQRRISAR